MNLQNNVAIVTGGATGIGQAISLALAKQGAKIVVNYNTSSTAADALVHQIIDLGGSAIAVQANVSKLSDCTILMEKAISTYGTVDILVNNAGITADNLIIRMTEEQFDAVIATNLKGVWNMCKVASRSMMKANYGRIINISSVSGLMGLAGQTNYSAAKAGVIGLTKALARELATRGITVNAIAPGYIETSMTAKLSAEITESAKKMIPLGRLGLPEDIAEAAVFLAAKSSAYITGQILAVDGGMSM